MAFWFADSAQTQLQSVPPRFCAAFPASLARYSGWNTAGLATGSSLYSTLAARLRIQKLRSSERCVRASLPNASGTQGSFHERRTNRAKVRDRYASSIGNRWNAFRSTSPNPEATDARENPRVNSLERSARIRDLAACLTRTGPDQDP